MSQEPEDGKEVSKQSGWGEFFKQRTLLHVGRSSSSLGNAAVGPKEGRARGGEAGEGGESLIGQRLSVYVDAVLFPGGGTGFSPFCGK